MKHNRLQISLSCLSKHLSPIADRFASKNCSTEGHHGRQGQTSGLTRSIFFPPGLQTYPQPSIAGECGAGRSCWRIGSPMS
eukprot:753990-Hanusia_phi.AAC.3